MALIMDSQSLINLCLGGFLAALGWFARIIWEAVSDLRKGLHDIEVDLPKNYIRKEEHSASMARIEDMFQRIFDKLDGKADK